MSICDEYGCCVRVFLQMFEELPGSNRQDTDNNNTIGRELVDPPTDGLKGGLISGWGKNSACSATKSVTVFKAFGRICDGAILSLFELHYSFMVFIKLTIVVGWYLSG